MGSDVPAEQEFRSSSVVRKPYDTKRTVQMLLEPSINFVRLGNSVSQKFQKKCGPWRREGPLCTHMWFTDLPVANSNLYKWHGVVVRSYGVYVKSWLFLFETDAWAWCTPSFMIQLQHLICFIYYDGMRFSCLWLICLASILKLQ